MMGSSNGITRGQLRPHFSGRSPPFLVAALCVGLGILGVSYWSLSSQYNDLEEQLRKAINDQNIIQNQLRLREDEFSRAKVELQKKEREVIDSNNQLKTKTDEINSFNSKLDSLKQTDDKCNENLSKKENELGDAMTKLKETELQRDKLSELKSDQNKETDNMKQENQQLKAQLSALQLRLNEYHNNSISSQSPVSNVGQPPLDSNALPSNKLENSLLLKKSSSEDKEPQKSQAEAPVNDAIHDNNAENPMNAISIKPPEPVIAEPIAQQNPSVGVLGEEDKKEDAIVPVDAAAANEIADEMKDQNKEEEPKDGQ